MTVLKNVLSVMYVDWDPSFDSSSMPYNTSTDVSKQQLMIMTTSSNGNISALLAICAGNSPVTGEFPAQRPVTRSFDVFFDLRQNKCLSKQWWGWWFESPSRPLWRHCNDTRYPSCTWCQGCNKSDNSPVHYSDFIMARWRLKSPAFFTQPLIQAQIKETSELCVTGLCAGTGDRWIPRTNDQ